jgi:hypothetical protein
MMQTRPHCPQFRLSVRSELSQPSTWSWSQSSKPAWHWLAQAPATHAALELGAATHVTPHAPQLAGAARSTSHPSEATPLQSANPGAHSPTAH